LIRGAGGTYVRRITPFLTVALLALVVLAQAGCTLLGLADPRDRRAMLVPVSDGWLAMGTFFDADLRVLAEDVPGARAWLDETRGEVARLERIYSRHDPASEVSLLNDHLAVETILGEPARVGPELESILYEAVEVWEGSGGAFDPTIGPLIDVWKTAAEVGVWPSLPALREAKRRVGSGGLLMPGGGVLDVTVHGMRIDLDGLSKGVVLDRLAKQFRERFPQGAALLSLGESSIHAIGDPEGRPVGGGWRLEVRSRNEARTRLATITLRDRAMSVSSSVGSLREIAGERVSHVIDPRIGGAVAGTVEAIVVAERAGLADGWSTALLVLGAQRDAMRLVEKAEVEAYVFESAGRIASTEGWESLEVDSSESPGEGSTDG